MYLLKASRYTNVENKWRSACVGQTTMGHTAERMAVFFFVVAIIQELPGTH